MNEAFELTPEFFDRVREGDEETVVEFCTFVEEQARRSFRAKKIERNLLLSEADEIDIPCLVRVKKLEKVRKHGFDPFTGGKSANPWVNFKAWINVNTWHCTVDELSERARSDVPIEETEETVADDGSSDRRSLEQDQLVTRFYDSFQRLRPRDQGILGIWMRTADDGGRDMTEKVKEFLGTQTAGGAGKAVSDAMARFKKHCADAGIGPDWFDLPREAWESVARVSAPAAREAGGSVKQANEKSQESADVAESSEGPIAGNEKEEGHDPA